MRANVVIRDKFAFIKSRIKDGASFCKCIKENVSFRNCIKDEVSGKNSWDISFLGGGDVTVWSIETEMCCKKQSNM